VLNRRQMFEYAALGGGTLAMFQATPAMAQKGSPGRAFRLGRAAEKIYADVVGFELDDTHCHAITPAMWAKDRETSPDLFLARLTLPGFAIPGYFPSGVWDEWVTGDAAKRASLDRKHGVSKLLREVMRDVRESAFVKFMVKDLAEFLGCKPNIDEVIEARNARGRDYPKYISDLYRDINLANVMTDTGCCEGTNTEGVFQYQQAIKPTQVRGLARVDTIQNDLLQRDLSFEDLEDQFTKRVRDALDGYGNVGIRSYGMKSYLLPRIGLLRPVYDRGVAAKSWEEYKQNRPTNKRGLDRDEQNQRGRDLLLFLLTVAMEECLARDMPMQFHAGDGEAPGIVLRNQRPYYLEEMVRFDKDGVMRRPKIVPIHGGYPLVGELTWLCHLYPNCYYEISIMNPYVHQGLSDRFREVMEVVPFTKILYGSDSFSVPEMYWLAGRWGKRYLSEALGIYVDDGVLSHEEAVAAARRIFYENNRELYKFT
jgi:hypothetical protein